MRQAPEQTKETKTNGEIFEFTVHIPIEGSHFSVSFENLTIRMLGEPYFKRSIRVFFPSASADQ